jgi:hypothetical protein
MHFTELRIDEESLLESSRKPLAPNSGDCPRSSIFFSAPSDSTFAQGFEIEA